VSNTEEDNMLSRLLAVAALAGLLSGATFVAVYEPAQADTKKTTAIKTTGLRAIAPGKARLVPAGAKLTTGTAGATCCTHWNTSTGGTGCATYEGACPDNTFTVECGASGCW
jgi:hypothetical protein